MSEASITSEDNAQHCGTTAAVIGRDTKRGRQVNPNDAVRDELYYAVRRYMTDR